MTRVGHEAPLVLDGRLQTGKHVVERHSEPGHLVSRRRHGQLARLARSHRFRAAAQHLDGTQRSRRERVAAERGREQCQGQEDHELVSLCGAAERERDARVAGRRLDDRRAARLDRAVPLGGVEHGDADSVLHGAAGVERFQLAEQLDAGVRRQHACELHAIWRGIYS